MAVITLNLHIVLINIELKLNEPWVTGANVIETMLVVKVVIRIAVLNIVFNKSY